MSSKERVVSGIHRGKLLYRPLSAFVMVHISVTATLVEELHLDRQGGQQRPTQTIDDTPLRQRICVSVDPFVRLTSTPFHGPGGLSIDKTLQGTTPAIALQASLWPRRLPWSYGGVKNHDAALYYWICFPDTVAKLRPVNVHRVAQLPMKKVKINVICFKIMKPVTALYMHEQGSCMASFNSQTFHIMPRECMP